MRHTNSILIGASALCLLAVGGHSPAAAESAAEFFKGKTITSISGYSPDATLTLLARITAQTMEKYTGGNIIIKTIPGGGGTAARNHMMKVKPDGLTVVLVEHGPKFIANAMFKRKGVKYNWQKFAPLGKAIGTTGLVAIAKNSTWTVATKPPKATFNYGESSPFYGPLMAEAFAWKHMSYIPGYRGTSQKAVAISRGEIQAGMVGVDAFLANPDLIKPLVTKEPTPAFPKLPTVRQAMAPGREKWVSYIENWSQIMNAGFAPAAVPADRLKFLEGALKKTWADPAFRKALKKVKLEPVPEFTTSSTIRGIMNGLAKLSPADVKEMKYVIYTKYKKKR